MRDFTQSSSQPQPNSSNGHQPIYSELAARGGRYNTPRAQQSRPIESNYAQVKLNENGFPQRGLEVVD